MPKSEATRTDPQHRLLLETVYECLENRGLIRNKGVETERLGFFIGFMGSEFNEYADEDSLSMIGQTNSAISGRLNHFFKSFGPSVVIDTACSSGLVALDCALKAIKNGDCNKAIVASVGLIISDRGMKQRINARLLSKDGRCYSFLEKASGYGRSEGCVALLIEKLNDSCEVIL
uniref:PKS_KS domain-containing protein n=1 Tax=Rhabditophanes sp. KR3021 TaxID=114890 RepID=A0AC35TUK0_9BILA